VSLDLQSSHGIPAPCKNHRLLAFVLSFVAPKAPKASESQAGGPEPPAPHKEPRRVATQPPPPASKVHMIEETTVSCYSTISPGQRQLDSGQREVNTLQKGVCVVSNSCERASNEAKNPASSCCILHCLCLPAKSQEPLSRTYFPV
jgi:hypothetical protein